MKYPKNTYKKTKVNNKDSVKNWELEPSVQVG